MTLRILFTLAILAGLAAAPAAQTFRWEPGHSDSSRISRAVERAVERAGRTIERLTRAAERTAERISARVESRADRISVRVQAQIDREVRAHVHAHVYTNIRPYRWSASRSRAGRDYSDAQSFATTDP